MMLTQISKSVPETPRKKQYEPPQVKCKMYLTMEDLLFIVKHLRMYGCMYLFICLVIYLSNPRGNLRGKRDGLVRSSPD